MLVGYNTNITFKGKVYHVQTEDSGVKNPVIITLLYIQGTILSSKKSTYAHVVSSPDYKEQVRELMKEQHKSMLKELIAGKHTGDPPDAAAAASLEAEPAAVPEPAAGPEEIQAERPQEKPADKPVAAKPAPAEKTTDEKREGKAQIDKSLDDILLDYIMKREE